MNFVTLALSVLCFSVFGCKQEQNLDEDPRNWSRVSIPINGRQLNFAVPHGHRFEVNDPRPRGIDLNAPQTMLFDAQYDFGSPNSDDNPDCTILLSVLKYVSPQPVDIAMDAFERAVHEAGKAAVPAGAPLAEVTSTEVTIEGRKWLHFTNTKGANSYLTPFSGTHALVVAEVFSREARRDEKYYASRRKIFDSFVSSISITGAN